MYLRNRFLGNRWANSLVIISSISTLSLALADDRGVRIHHAIEVEFETERGRVHHVQGSDDMQHWTNIDSGTTGRGEAVSTLLSIQSSTNQPFNFFRVVTDEIPTNGPAPIALTGAVLQLDDTLGEDALRFLTETNGVKSSGSWDSFDYLFTRLSTNEIQFEMTRPGESATSRRDLVSLTFSTTTTGNWIRDTYRKGKLKDRSSGNFVLTTSTTDSTHSSSGETQTTNAPVLPTEIPSSAIGLAFTFGGGEHRERLEVLSSQLATIFGDDESPDDSHSATYTYEMVGTNQANLVVILKPGKRDEYVLTFKNAAQGTFVRKEIKNDKLDDTDAGAFSVALVGTTNSGGSSGSEGNTDSGNGTETQGNTEAFTSLLGKQLSFDDDVPADIYSFATETTGIKTHDTDKDSFTYTYTVTSPTTAKLVATFKPGRWSEFALTFLGAGKGTFIQSEFDKTTLKSTKSGKFQTP
jgi:hypothetical protein